MEEELAAIGLLPLGIIIIAVVVGIKLLVVVVVGKFEEVTS